MQKPQNNTIFSMFLLCFLIVATFLEPSNGEEMPLRFTREELSQAAGYGEERLSSVLVTGSVLCEDCSNEGHKISRGYVSGAKIAVGCKNDRERRKITWVQGTTDEYGDFIVDLPSELHSIQKLEAACIVKILHLPKKSTCHHRHNKKSAGIKFSSIGNSIRVYTTGIIKMEHQKKLSCSKKEQGSESVW